jgi:glutathione S-transferase
MTTTHANKITVYHIPVCPFSQRLEILLALKNKTDLVEFKVIDISTKRPDWLLEKTGGTTALPVLEMADGTILKKSLVIMQYIEDVTQDCPIASTTPKERAIENLMVTLADSFTMAGYKMVMNQSLEQRGEFQEAMLDSYRNLNRFLERYATGDTFLFNRFGWVEAIFTPMFMRFWFLEYYENFTLPNTEEFTRVAKWREACLAEPNAQQVSFDEIIKLYYDYAIGAGNGKLPEGRKVSSFNFTPHWQQRPMPPADKYNHRASDQELGLL